MHLLTFCFTLILSLREVEAGLFIYSPRKLVIADPRLRVARAEQIDLPPTLALLLGTPIPFASLGRAMWAFFAQDADIALKAARANALQVCGTFCGYSICM